MTTITTIALQREIVAIDRILKNATLEIRTREGLVRQREALHDEFLDRQDILEANLEAR